jgi:hypothetical protein
MLMKHLVHDLTSPVELDQRKQIGEPVPGLIFYLQANSGHCLSYFDTMDVSLDVSCRRVRGIPI